MKTLEKPAYPLYKVSNILRFETTSSTDGELFHVDDCQWIRSRQYLELASTSTNLPKIVCIRYCFKFESRSYVVVTYKHVDQFEIVVLEDVSTSNRECFLRTLNDDQFRFIAEQINLHEHAHRSQSWQHLIGDWDPTELN